MEMARASGKRKREVARKLREQVKRNVKAGSKPRKKTTAKVTKRQGVVVTSDPKPSPHLKPKAAPKAAPKAKPKAKTKKTSFVDASGKTRSLKPKHGIAPKRGPLTPAQKRANEQRRKNLRSETGGLLKTSGEQMKALDKAKRATNYAITAATLPIGGGVGRGALTGAKAVGRGIKTKGAKAIAGVKATGEAVKSGAKTGVAKTKRAARIARVAARKADKALLKKQGLRRTRGKIEQINPFKQRGTGKPKAKAKRDEKNPFAGTGKKATPKAKRKAKRKAKKAAPTQRSREQAKSRRVEEGYRKFDKDRKARSRKRGKV